MRIGVLSIFVVVILAVGSAVAQNSTSPLPQSGSNTSGSTATISETDDAAIGEPSEWVRPKYPKQALKERLQGKVVLSFIVDQKGHVSKVVNATGDPQLIEAAVGAVRKWKYILKDQPADVTTKAAFVFNVNDSGQPTVKVAFGYAEAVDLGPIFKVGNGVTAPKIIYSPSPEYSKKAKDEKYQGVCVLSLIVGPDGKTYEIKVTSSLGEGLDEKAIEAVRKWKFHPGLKDGKPVSVAISIEVNFRLY